MKRLLIGTLLVAVAGAASAGPATLGTPLGVGLGEVLGGVLGTALPIAGSGLLLVAASSLVIGIRIARKKRKP